MRPNRALATGLAAVIAASFLGWVAGRQIRSPADEAAATAPPEASMITVAAERRVLTSDVTARGTVRYGSPQVVTLGTSLLKKSNPIVTSAPVKGAVVNEGSVLLTVSGRPVLALKGERPAHRDLGPGMVGDDVRQLEEGLARLGFSPGPVDGNYDSRTAKAVTAWYLSVGWTPFGPTDDQLQVLRSAQTDLFSAKSDLLNAYDTLTAANSALAGAREKATAARAASQAVPSQAGLEGKRFDAERLKAQADVSRGEEALQTAVENEHIAHLRLAEARSPAAGPSAAQVHALESAVARTTAAVPVARAELNAALAAQLAADRAGLAAVNSRMRTLDSLQAANPRDEAAIAVAREELAAARAEAEASRLRTAADVAARQANLDDAVNARRNAELVLAEATAPGGSAAGPVELASLTATARQASSAVAAARTDLTVAKAMLGLFTVSPQTTSAADASRSVSAADAEVSNTAEGVATAQRRVALISTRATDTAVAKLGGTIGTQVPADELVFFPTFPVRIDEGKAKIGEQLAGAALTVTNSDLAIDGALSADDAKLVRVGARVTIADAELGTRAEGVVTAVADTPGTNGVDPQRFYFQVTPDEGTTGLLVGASVILTITVDSTEGDVLTVPIAALSVAADGTPRAQVQNPDGTTRFVPVSPGLTSKGLVAVTPLEGARLEPDELVVVGSGTKTGGKSAKPSK